MTNEVRVRFAPSPTGPLHIGGIRTALYNYLFAINNLRAVTLISVSRVIILFIFSYWLSGTLGLYGIGISVLISEIIASVILPYYFVNKILTSDPNQAQATPISPTQPDILPTSALTQTPPDTLNLTPTDSTQTQTLSTITPFPPESLNKERVSVTSNTQGLVLGVLMAVMTVSISLGIILLILRSRRQ